MSDRDRPLRSVNPATEALIASYEEQTETQVDRRLGRAAEAFAEWRALALDQRVEPLDRLANLLEQEVERCAATITQEMGKPIAQSEAEVRKCAWACRHYAQNAARYLQPVEVPTEAAKSYVRYDPLGPLLSIMPWNFPFWQVFRFAAAAIAAGNVVLLKHAPNVLGCALLIESLFQKAGFPQGVFQLLLIRESRVAGVIGDERIRGVTLTGSDRAGRAVACAAARGLKKVVLELGGSDPLIVLDDADLDLAVTLACRSRLNNSGQTCIAAKRLIVQRPRLAPFLTRLQQALEGVKVGDPQDPSTSVGPLAADYLRENLHRQVEESLAAGATLVMGGYVPEGKGFFYPVTLLHGAKKGMPVLEEEVFGPVVVVQEASDDEEALAVANDTRYGLGAAVITADPARGERMAARLEAGAVFINEMVKSDPRLPFGGVKQSGYGRELGREGILEFCNTKSVWINP